MCCGEAMPESGNVLSRNPNICASCSSMADGMDEPGLPAEAPEMSGMDPGRTQGAQKARDNALAKRVTERVSGISQGEV